MSRAATVVRHSVPRAGGSAPQTTTTRPRRRAAAAPVVPLGSLTQQPTAQGSCRTCGSAQVTQLAMQLTDGTPVQFTSCHRCEARRWEHDGIELSVRTVLERTRKIA